MQISKPKKGYKLVDAGFRKYKEVPEDWDCEEFQGIIKKDKTKILEIQTSGYHNQGKIPIIDQGKDLICGYTDDSSLIYSGELPVIVFGDHTLVVKFIDFPFAVGADGTKIIQINNKKGLTKFFYYAILNSNLTSEGYKRHFIKLREQKFCYPSIAEQQKIALILSNVDNTLKRTNQLIQKIELLKNGLMQKLFTKGIGHTKFKKVEWLFGKEIEIPEEWEMVELQNCIDPNTIITYGIVQAGPNITSGIPYIRTNDVAGDFINTEKLLKTTQEIHKKYKRTRLKEGDIICTVRASVGKFQIIPKELDNANLSRGIARISPKTDLNNIFLYYSLNSEFIRKQFNSLAKGSTFLEITMFQLRKIKTMMPSKIEEQKHIATILSNVDSQINKEKLQKSNLELLKKGLMQKLFTGQIRVKINVEK